MSKSRGNLVRLSDELAEHGVDAVRLTMVFAGPPEDDIDWADVSPGRLQAVPGPGLAAGRRRHERGGRGPGRRAIVALRKVTHRTVARRGAGRRDAAGSTWPWPG